jgi:hypothetical protein
MSFLNKIIGIILLTAGLLTGQSLTNQQFLETFSKEKAAEWHKQRAEAEDYAEKKRLPIRKVLADGRLIEIQKLQNGQPLYYITHNAGAATTSRVTALYPGGALGLSLSGSGYTKIGEWDGGAVLTTHQEFSGRVSQADSPSTTSWHATHVAGTIVAAGLHAPAKGMAYGASLSAYDWNSDESEMASAASAGLEISNHSYGYITGWYWNGTAWTDEHINKTVNAVEDFYFGFYSEQAADWDEIAYNAPYYLIVKSAGNDRGDGPADAGTGGKPEKDGGADGYDCISHAGVAKNILTVGAVNELSNYQQPSDVVMSSFSGWGPSDDGRIKPDIVAKGVNLTSAHSNSTLSYANSSGTSMSSPAVAGALVLLQQHYQNLNSGAKMKSATLKALVLHTAMEAGTHDGPDYIFGWGLLDAKAAAEKITENQTLETIIEAQLTNAANYTKTIYSNGTEPIRATIVWTDPAGTPVANQLDPTDKMLVNDLDMKITRADNTWYPWSLDPANPAAAATQSAPNRTDNVEQVSFQPSEAGLYTISVERNGTLTGGVQNFSMILSGCLHESSLPVSLGPFRVRLLQEGNLLEWQTESEQENAGFNIYRGLADYADWDFLSGFMIENSLKGEFSSSEPKYYTFLDKKAEAGKQYRYLLSEVNYDGKETFHQNRIIFAERPAKAIIQVLSPYPNPFNSVLNVPVFLTQSAEISIIINDLAGKEIFRLNEDLAAGSHQIPIAMKNQKSGLYLLRIVGDGFSQSQKALFLK